MSSYSALYDCWRETHHNFNVATQWFFEKQNQERRPLGTEAYLALHFLNSLTVEHVEIFIAAEVVALHLLVVFLFVICLKKKRFKERMCHNYRDLFEWRGQENTKSSCKHSLVWFEANRKNMHSRLCSMLPCHKMPTNLTQRWERFSGLILTSVNCLSTESIWNLGVSQ